MAYTLQFKLKDIVVNPELNEHHGELILRMAIGHLHKLARKHLPLTRLQQLPRSTPAWAGDWCRVIAGKGLLHNQVSVLHERRNRNVVAEDCVSTGIAMCKSDGHGPAGLFLKESRISSATIRRVLLTNRVRGMKESADIT